MDVHEIPTKFHEDEGRPSTLGHVLAHRRQQPGESSHGKETRQGNVCSCVSCKRLTIVHMRSAESLCGFTQKLGLGIQNVSSRRYWPLSKVPVPSSHEPCTKPWLSNHDMRTRSRGKKAVSQGAATVMACRSVVRLHAAWCMWLPALLVSWGNRGRAECILHRTVDGLPGRELVSVCSSCHSNCDSDPAPAIQLPGLGQ